MKKGVGYVVIFALGGILVLLVMRLTGQSRVAGEEQAKRVVLSSLDKTPAAPSASSSDTPLIRAAARIEPAVVNIDVAGERIREGQDMFGRMVREYQPYNGKGSGVIISPDGYIITNNHVVEGSSEIRVSMVDGRKMDGRLIAADPESDLAVVKIEGAKLPAAEWGDSDKLKIGEYVLAVGYPLGIGTTVTHGIISATDRRNLETAPGRILKRALQTDAPINPGNSGGALANLDGQLIGINTAIASQSGGSVGLGFAIPSNAAREIVRELIAHGKAPGTPYLGISGIPNGPDIAAQYTLPSDKGVIVAEVIPGSAAANAGLQQMDILIALDSKVLTNMEDVRSLLDSKRVGEEIQVKILRRDGKEETKKMVLGAKPLISRRP